MKKSSRLLCLFSATVMMLLAACGQTQMMQTTGTMRAHMIRGNYNGALATLRQAKTSKAYKEQDRVMFWMDEGMLLHLTGHYAESNMVLEKTEQRIKELYTTSISKNLTATVTSDAAKDYAGEDYEDVMLNVMKAMNYLGLGQKSDALVEARKINEKLALFNTRYKDQKNSYSQDAFAHWLMGLLFEMEGSYDDARIAYAKAMEVYVTLYASTFRTPPPSYLGEDMVRAAILSSDQESAARWRQKLNQPQLGGSVETLKTNGEIVLVHLNGEGPTKSDFFINCVFGSATYWGCDAEPGQEFVRKTRITITDGTAVRIAFPQLNIHAPVNPGLMLSVGGQRAHSVLAEPISFIAAKTMADKMGRIFRDAVVRAIAKVIASKAAGKTAGVLAGGEKKGGFGSLLAFVAEKGTSAAMQAAEEADKRAWTTLPSQFEVARLMVAPGTHTVNIALPNGRTASIPGVKVEAGKRVVMTYLTIP